MISNPLVDKKALIIIDMINQFDFQHGEELYRHTVPAAKKIYELKTRAKEVSIPVIYVNDNFKNWQGDFQDLVNACLNESKLGRDIVELIKPEEGDYHILKPSYSGFYATPLHILLEHLNVTSLIITGIAGNMCVQFTANDAFMLRYQLFVPSDCVASQTERANIQALEQMKEILRANTCLSDTINL
ncbi:cysteine hydrolase [Anaerobacillus alkaliphilus]|uniref:Cysteine hydrolase n=1 Tax=Anaerobacillus alkaliphilus TaxID=1548597 RepID=A0A4Q0VXV7_9BACI|nr:isochorismatase family cysteine hydrolase [Anaerobacillus alkaliphilus]RXJ02598.1 cysteine hydrolase [Anaerobacillus alkaliphilus]